MTVFKIIFGIVIVMEYLLPVVKYQIFNIIPYSKTNKTSRTL